MRVLVTNTMRGWSGETAYVREIVLGLLRRGCDIALASRRGSEVGRRCAEAGVRVVDLALGRAPHGFAADLVRLRRELRARRPDVLLMNASRDTWTAGTAARLFAPSVPRVRVKHNLKRIRTGPLNRLLYGTLAQRLIAPSQPLLDQLRAVPFVRAVPVELIWQGVRLEPFRAGDAARARARAELLARWFPGRDPLLLVYCSRLTERKHPELAIEAVLRLAVDRAREVALLVVGDPSTECGKRCTALAAGRPEVVFAGWQGDVAPFLAGGDAFVLPSPDEAFGMAIVEALAAGAVPVLPDRPPFPELTAQGACGVLFPWAGGVAALVDAIRRLRDAPDVMAAMRERGRAHAERFDAERMVDATWGYLQRVAAEHGAEGAAKRRR